MKMSLRLMTLDNLVYSLAGVPKAVLHSHDEGA